MNRWSSLVAVVLLLALTSAALACPNCKESVPASDAANPSTVAAGFNTSIYFMLGAFFCVLGMVGYMTVKAVRTTPRATPTRAFPVVPPRD